MDSSLSEALGFARASMTTDRARMGFAGDRWISGQPLPPRSLPMTIRSESLESTFGQRVQSGMSSEDASILAELGARGELLRTLLFLALFAFTSRGQSNQAAIAEALTETNKQMQYLEGTLTNPLDIGDVLAMSGSRQYKGYGDTRQPDNRVPELASSDLPYPLGIPAHGPAVPASDTAGSGFDPITVARMVSSSQNPLASRRSAPAPPGGPRFDVASRRSAPAPPGGARFDVASRRSAPAPPGGARFDVASRPSTASAAASAVAPASKVASFAQPTAPSRNSAPTPAPVMESAEVQSARRHLAQVQGSGTASAASIANAQRALTMAIKKSPPAAASASQPSMVASQPSMVASQPSTASVATVPPTGRKDRPDMVASRSSMGPSSQFVDSEYEELAMRATMTTAQNDPGVFSEVSNSVRRSERPVEGTHPFFFAGPGQQNGEEERFVQTGTLVRLKGEDTTKMTVLDMLFAFVEGLQQVSIRDVNSPITSGQADQILRSISTKSLARLIRIVTTELDMHGSEVQMLMRANAPSMAELHSLARQLNRDLRPQATLEHVARQSGAGLDGSVGARLSGAASIQPRAPPSCASTRENPTVSLLVQAGIISA
jgi:hypothetical protein